jgi:hypothetical protein
VHDSVERATGSRQNGRDGRPDRGRVVEVKLDDFAAVPNARLVERPLKRLALLQVSHRGEHMPATLGQNFSRRAPDAG